MSRNGTALLVLILAVLSLAVFVMITFVGVMNDRRMAEVGAEMISAYYQADTLAEQIVNEAAAADSIPEEIRGVEIMSGVDIVTGTDIVSFSCPVLDEKELHVELAVTPEGYDVTEWRLRDTGAWEPDGTMPLLQGGEGNMPWMK